MANCAGCNAEIDEADAYYNDNGDLVCGTCEGKASTERLERMGEEEEAASGFFAPETSAVKKGGIGGLLLGILMMIGAAVWFFVGLEAGYIYFYPPILFIFGLVALINGIITMGKTAD